MSFPPDHPVQAGAAAAVSGGEASASPDWEHLAPGARWRGVYQIGDALSDVTHGKSFKATHVGALDDVVVRVVRASGEGRQRVWEKLIAARGCGLIEAVEAIEADGRRAEVTRAPPMQTLHAWQGGRRLPPAEIEMIVRQLAHTLAELHGRGVAHLNLRPDRIYAVSTEAGLRMRVGGLELATLVGPAPAGLVPIPVDPFYAPPEAAGLFQHEAGAGLRAWDWWSLGRVLQELVLGRHVLGHLLDRDVSRATPELSARADNLLREREAAAGRAGAVDAMPAMDKNLETLLRGLLSSCRDGRWGRREVERWLKNEPVKHRYHLDRHERLFVWEGEGMTVPEAGEFFARAENWKHAVRTIFQVGDAGTLRAFVEGADAQRKLAERLHSLVKLPEGAALAAVPAEIAREVTAALALAHIAGGHTPPRLRGLAVDDAGVRAWLQPEAQPDGLALVRAWLERPVIQQVEQIHAETGRRLAELARHAEAAWRLVRENNLPGASDVGEEARLIAICLESDTALAGVFAELHKQYACSRDPALDAIFKSKEDDFVIRAVLAWTSADSARFRYVTHRDWAEEQYRVLKDRGERLAAGASWLRLAGALRVGAPVFGNWARFVAIWVGAAAACAWLGYFQPGALLAAGGLAFAAAAARVVFGKVHAGKMTRFLSAGRPWLIGDAPARCREEAGKVVVEAERLPTAGALAGALKDVNAEIGKLPLSPTPAPIGRPAGFVGSVIAGALSWVPLLVLAVIVAWRIFPSVVQLPALFLSWLPAPPPVRSEAAEKAPSADEAEKTTAAEAAALAEQQREIAEALAELRKIKAELDRRSQPPPKVAWPFKAPAAFQNVSVREKAVGAPTQTTAAEEAARLLLNSYDPKTIDALVAVRVPVASGVGLMLFDGKAGKLAGPDVYVINYVPLTRTWLELGGTRALFLGAK